MQYANFVRCISCTTLYDIGINTKISLSSEHTICDYVLRHSFTLLVLSKCASRLATADEVPLEVASWIMLTLAQRTYYIRSTQQRQTNA